MTHLRGSRRFVFVLSALVLTSLPPCARAQCAGPIWSTAALAPNRPHHSIAFDSLRQRVILFGGDDYDTGQFSNTTWAFDGFTWSQLHPATSPPGRDSLNNMAYDSFRDRVVVYGGFSEPQTFDTWEFNGTTWNYRLAFGPQVTDEFGMAYDGARHRTVIFGGQPADGGPPSNETWLWDGNFWTHAHPATSPPGLLFPSMAYDPDRQRIVLFGGSRADNSVSDETWEWNGTTWTLRTDARATAGGVLPMAYDSARHTMVLVNTHGDFGAELWELGATGWSQRPGTGLDICIPGTSFGPMTFLPGLAKCFLTLDQAIGATTQHYFFGAAAAPSVLTQPITQIAQPNSFFQLRITATCQPGLTYRWRHNGTPLSDINVGTGNRFGSTTPFFSMSGSMVNTLASGQYDCVVTSPCGTSTSEAARVTIGCDEENIDYRILPASVLFQLRSASDTPLASAAATFIGRIGIRYDPNCISPGTGPKGQVVSIDLITDQPTVTTSWPGGSATMSDARILLDPTHGQPAPPTTISSNHFAQNDVAVRITGTITYNVLGQTGTVDLGHYTPSRSSSIITIDGTLGPSITFPFAGDFQPNIGLGDQNPFVGITATIHAPFPHCPADFDDGSGTGTPDFGVTIEDLLYYLTLFTAGDIHADLDDGSGTGTLDGGVTIEDLLYFLQHFAGGC